jgi:hypothetical protein
MSGLQAGYDRINTIPRAVPIAQGRPGESSVYRRIGFQGDLLTKCEGFETLYHMLRSSASKYAALNCMGYRDLIKMHQDEVSVEKIVGGKFYEFADINDIQEKKSWRRKYLLFPNWDLTNGGPIVK